MRFGIAAAVSLITLTFVEVRCEWKEFPTMKFSPAFIAELPDDSPQPISLAFIRHLILHDDFTRAKKMLKHLLDIYFKKENEIQQHGVVYALEVLQTNFRETIKETSYKTCEQAINGYRIAFVAYKKARAKMDAANNELEETNDKVFDKESLNALIDLPEETRKVTTDMLDHAYVTFEECKNDAVFSNRIQTIAYEYYHLQVKTFYQYLMNYLYIGDNSKEDNCENITEKLRRKANSENITEKLRRLPIITIGYNEPVLKSVAEQCSLLYNLYNVIVSQISFGHLNCVRKRDPTDVEFVFNCFPSYKTYECGLPKELYFGPLPNKEDPGNLSFSNAHRSTGRGNQLDPTRGTFTRRGPNAFKMGRDAIVNFSASQFNADKELYFKVTPEVIRNSLLGIRNFPPTGRSNPSHLRRSFSFPPTSTTEYVTSKRRFNRKSNSKHYAVLV